MYVTNQDKKSVYVINSSSNEVIKNITGVGEGHLIYNFSILITNSCM